MSASRRTSFLWPLPLILIGVTACAQVPVTPTVGVPVTPTVTIPVAPAATLPEKELNPHVEIFANTTMLNIGDVITVTGRAVDIGLPNFESRLKDNGLTETYTPYETKPLPYDSHVLQVVSVKDIDEQTVITLRARYTGSTELIIRATRRAQSSSEGAFWSASLTLTVLPPRPEIKWDTRPETLIVKATFCCGYADWPVFQNYIPDVQIWGDGRMIWADTSFTAGHRRRRVLETYLTPDQISQVLERAANDGFFGWQDEYIEPDAYDFANQCLSIKLTSVSKTVCEYVEGAPIAFHKLYDYLVDGLATNGTDFVPTRGYLTSAWPNYSGAIPSHVDLQWPADSLGFSLKEAADGHWVEGEVLAFAWRLVNEHEEAVIQDDEGYYKIGLRIPGVSMEYPSQFMEPLPTEPQAATNH